MDTKNLFMTPTTAALVRLEYAAALVLCVVLALVHLAELRWWVFLGLFAVIDVVGYLPGRLAYTRSPEHRIARRYYVLYNIAHSGLTAAAVAGVWCLTFGPEWSLLALPIHLLGDRALFGNFLKPFGLAFEPEANPTYTAFRRSYVLDSTRVSVDDDRPAPTRLTADVG